MKQIELCLSIYLNVQSYNIFVLYLHDHSVKGINANDAISARTYIPYKTSKTFNHKIKGKHTAVRVE